MVSSNQRKLILEKKKLLAKKKKVVKGGKVVKKKTTGTSVKKVAESDQLKWKEVEIPDTLDDFGGLYGLEELEGVGVEYVDGKVQFVVKKDDQLKPAEEESEEKLDEENEGTIESPKEQMEEPAEEYGEDTTIYDTAEEDLPEDIIVPEKREKKDKKEKKSIDDSILEKGIISQTVNFENIELPDEVELPEWLGIDLSNNTLQGLSKLGFTRPTPIQKKCIPRCLEGEDIIGKASTGSGKTLAYGIPILEKILTNRDSEFPTGVIFTPTRELAKQVVNHLNEMSKYFPFTSNSIISITGGLSIQKQERLLKYKNSGQIIVATPGRFLELIEKNKDLANKISNLDILVLDEADRLLQDGHFDEFEQIIKILKSLRTKKEKWQSLIFSATFAKELFSKLSNKTYQPKSNDKKSEQDEIIELFDEKLKFKSKPTFIDLNPNGKLSDDITEALVECLPAERDLYLYYFLLMYPGTTLVFTNAIDSVKRLVPLLNSLQISTFAIHSNMIQKQRLKNIENFTKASKTNKNGKSTVLIASDVAARGLDIPGIEHVVHYHLPRSADVYIHRSGRTARSGNEGVSVMICSPQEASGPLRNLRKALASDKVKFRGKASKKWTKDVNRLNIESDIVAQIKDRVRIAGELADNDISTKSLTKEDNWVKKAAEELDLDFDDLGDLEDDILKRNRNKKEEKMLDKNQVSKRRYELTQLLKIPIKKDLRRSYITGGLQNLADSMVKGIGHDTILGHDKVDALQELKKRDAKKKAKKSEPEKPITKNSKVTKKPLKKDIKKVTQKAKQKKNVE